MEFITSRNNKWIKLALRLKQKKWRDKENSFLLEGIRIIEDACNQGIKNCVCFIHNNQNGNERVQKLIEKADKLHWLFLNIDESLMDLISGTENGQGIILICHKKQYRKEDLLKPLTGHYVVLDTIQDPGNMGTIIRTSAAAGVQGILLTEGCTDIYSEKVVRSSMGSILRIPIYENIDISFLKELKDKGQIPLLGTSLANAISYREVGDLQNGIFIFGNEGNGIRPEILDITDQNLYIPIYKGVESLNVSIAAAVILFHFI